MYAIVIVESAYPSMSQDRPRLLSFKRSVARSLQETIVMLENELSKSESKPVFDNSASSDNIKISESLSTVRPTTSQTSAHEQIKTGNIATNTYRQPPIANLPRHNLVSNSHVESKLPVSSIALSTSSVRNPQVMIGHPMTSQVTSQPMNQHSHGNLSSRPPSYQQSNAMYNTQEPLNPMIRLNGPQSSASNQTIAYQQHLFSQQQIQMQRQSSTMTFNQSNNLGPYAMQPPGHIPNIQTLPTGQLTQQTSYGLPQINSTSLPTNPHQQYSYNHQLFQKQQQQNFSRNASGAQTINSAVDSANDNPSTRASPGKFSNLEQTQSFSTMSNKRPLPPPAQINSMNTKNQMPVPPSLVASKNRGVPNPKVMSSLKDKDKGQDKISDKEESFLNLQRRKDVINAKLTMIERRSLVGSKGPAPISFCPKNQWDYLTNEVKWMAIDFHQELRWKLRFSEVISSLCKEAVIKKRTPKSESISQEDENPNENEIRAVAKTLSNMIQQHWIQFETSNSIIGFEQNIPLESKLNHSRGQKSVPVAANPVGGLGIVLLDHQRSALNRVIKLNESGFGSVVVGRRCVGKTTLLVAAIDMWLSNKAKKNLGQALLFASRRTALRWISEIERILPLRSNMIWLPESKSAEGFSSDQGFNNQQSFPSSDIVLCILENSKDYIALLKADVLSCAKISGVLIDIRGSNSWFVPSGDKHWIDELGSIIQSTTINRAVVCDDSLPPEQLKMFSRYLDPTNIPEDQTTSLVEDGDDDWKTMIQSSVFFPNPLNDPPKKDLNTLFVEVLVGNAVESFAAAQVREEVVSQDMDSLQHLKYFQVMDTLVSQLAFLGENPWILSQALTLLRRVCFHEAFISIGSSRKIYISQNESNADPDMCGIGLGFGLTHSSLFTGVPSDANKLRISPTVDGFNECSNGDVRNEARNDPYADTCTDYLSKLMSISTEDESVPITRQMSGSFAPGPLSSKLGSPARFNMNGNFYDSIGSCKLQVLCALIARFSGLRIVIMVSSLDEQLTVHNFLNRLGFDHTYAGITGSKLNDPVNLDGSGMDTVSWLKAQTIIQKFNRTYQTASALMITTKDVFLHPGLLPWKADVVIILSDDWVTPTDIRSCFRLRLTSAGPSGDPVTVVRIVAKGTLEELVARRGSLLNLQGFSLSELFPAFTHAFQGAFLNSNATTLSMLSKAPPAGLVRKLRDLSLCTITANQHSPINKPPSAVPSPTSDDALSSCALWLQTLRLGLVFAEFQFSKLGKYVPYCSKSCDVKMFKASDSLTVQFRHHMQDNFSGNIKDKLADLMLCRYVNVESVITKTGNKSSVSVKRDEKGKKYQITTLAMRLIDARVRAAVLDVDVLVSKSLTSFQSGEQVTFRESEINRLKSQGIGPKSLTSSEQQFRHLVQSIVPIISTVEGPKEGRDLQSPVVNNSQGQNGTSFFRASQLFRQVLAQNKRKGIPMDSHIYILNHLQSASKLEYRLQGSSNLQAVSVNIYLDGSNKKKLLGQESNASPRPIKLESDGKSSSQVLSSLYKVDLTTCNQLLEFNPSMRENYSRYPNNRVEKAEILPDSQVSSSGFQNTFDDSSWLRTEDGLILCVPMLFHDESFELTTTIINKSNRSGVFRNTDYVRERYFQLQATATMPILKNFAFISDNLEKLIASINSNMKDGALIFGRRREMLRPISG